MTLADRRVLLVGFASPAVGGAWFLTRFVAACCAADAAAVKVEARGQPSPGDGQWVEAVGTLQGADESVDPAAAVQIPRVDVQQVTAIDDPRLPYL